MLTLKIGAADRTHVTEIEVLVNCSRDRSLQVPLDPLWRQNQTPLFQPWHRLVVFRGSFFQAEFLGVEEKGLVFLGIEDVRNTERTADRTPEILPPVEWGLASNRLPHGLPGSGRGRTYKIEIISRVECFVADKVVKVPVPLCSPRLGGYLHRTRCRPSELSAVVRG